MMIEELNKLEQSTPPRTAAAVHFEVRNVKDARQLFAAFIEDERELNRAAAIFIKLGDGLSGRGAGGDERARTLRSFYEKIAFDPATGIERPRDERGAALQHTLAEMRELNLTLRSSPQARRAHSEIDGYVHATDDLRSLFEVPEDRTRAEHASHLNRINKDARDLFERGAGLYGDTLIIPREASGTADTANQVRLGSAAHAVNEFETLIGEEQAKIKAAQFVELGNEIAGRTADAETRLVTFRAFYQEIKRDGEGRVRTLAEQAAQIEPVLERMRTLAAAMREQEWLREPHETVSFEDWERGLEDRQRDAERETYGRLAFHANEVIDAEHDVRHEERGPAEAKEHDDERAPAGGSFARVEYERIPLAHMPPRLPEGLTAEDEERLRYDLLPRLDRQIESGVRPQDILRALLAQAERETARDRELKIARLLIERAPAANREHSLTREEEARALYTLRALGAVNADEIERSGFATRERAAAIDTVGARLAQDYRDDKAELKTFADLESERDRINQEALRFRERQRASPEFQSQLAAAREREADGRFSELEALARGNNSHPASQEKAHVERSNYPELVGGLTPASPYALRQAENETARREARRQLESSLVDSDLEREKSDTAARLEQWAGRFSRIAGRDISSAAEARGALDLQLRRTREALASLIEEREALRVERTSFSDRHSNPLYVSVPSQGSLRLPIESVNEYRALMSIAGDMGISVRAYSGRHGPEITGFDEARDRELNFARDYVAYRQLDDTTRLLNGHRLFREFNARLDGARDTHQLREVIKEVRQENYARWRHPERYRSETDDLLLRAEPSRRPLTEIEMRALMLSPAPPHYTGEMRDLRLNYAVSARDKAGRIKGLEQGTLTPSPPLALLLKEFERTRSESPAQHARNIKSFLADYLNPPEPNRNRFSAHNLYELGQKLTPAERDYLFIVVDRTKQNVISGGDKVRRIEEMQIKTHDLGDSPPSAREQQVKAHVSEPPSPHRKEINELRGQLEENVAAYLVSVVEKRGVRSLESSHESLQHAEQITRIIKDTFAQKGRAPEMLNLTDDRIAAVAGKLVGELPYALREHRSRIIGQGRADRLAEHPNEIIIMDGRQEVGGNYEREVIGRMAHKAIQPAVALVYSPNPGDETVEQKNSRTFEQLPEPVFTQTSVPAAPGSHLEAHLPRAHELTIGHKEQHMRQRTLSR